MSPDSLKQGAIYPRRCASPMFGNAGKRDRASTSSVTGGKKNGLECRLEVPDGFAVGGALCVPAQLLIDKTKLTPARILVGYVVTGVILGAVGLYQPLADFAGAGANTPLTGFGNVIAKGVRRAVDEKGLLGARPAGCPRLPGELPPRLSSATSRRCSAGESRRIDCGVSGDVCAVRWQSERFPELLHRRLFDTADVGTGYAQPEGNLPLRRAGAPSIPKRRVMIPLTRLQAGTNKGYGALGIHLAEYFLSRFSSEEITSM